MGIQKRMAGQEFKLNSVSFYRLSSEPLCYTASQSFFFSFFFFFPVSSLFVPLHLLKSFLHLCNKVLVPHKHSGDESGGGSDWSSLNR